MKESGAEPCCREEVGRVGLAWLGGAKLEQVVMVVGASMCVGVGGSAWKL